MKNSWLIIVFLQIAKISCAFGKISWLSSNWIHFTNNTKHFYQLLPLLIQQLTSNNSCGLTVDVSIEINPNLIRIILIVTQKLVQMLANFLKLNLYYCLNKLLVHFWSLKIILLYYWHLINWSRSFSATSFSKFLLKDENGILLLDLFHSRLCMVKRGIVQKLNKVRICRLSFWIKVAHEIS